VAAAAAAFGPAAAIGVAMVPVVAEAGAKVGCFLHLSGLSSCGAMV